jgi:16S rRNA (cytidine1402-2'-O)-methyltransferase
VEGHVSDEPVPGTLYVVSTPIGHMGDFSFRAVETLRSVGLILAEDTRHSRRLLDRYEIATPLLAYHEHNEAKMTPRLVERLGAGESFALISDAGTPLVSDPGARLVDAAAMAGLPVVAVPGASAMLAALVVSGLDASRFTFFGFLPRSGGERTAAIAALASLAHTAILYESPNRVAATLGALASAGGGERACVVARELTKQFEEVRRGTVAELAAYHEHAAPKGEVVIVLGGAPKPVVTDETVRERVRALRAAGMSARDVAAAVADELDVPKRLAYRMTQE